MLVLSVHSAEFHDDEHAQVVLTVGGERIVVTLLRTIGSKARLGFEADKERVIINRRNIQDEIDAAKTTKGSKK